MIVEDKFTFNGNYKWVDEFRISYQITTRANIGKRLADVTPAIAERLLDMVYSAIKIAGPAKFKVGVRMNKYKTVFEKSYTPNWTTKIYVKM